MPLPENEGYRYCPPCERWVAATNLHCSLCAACPSKDGRTYRHCTPCGRCVKPTYEHCPQCNRCFLAGGHTGCAKETTSTNSTCKRSAEVAKVTDDDMPEKLKRSRKKKKKGKKEGVRQLWYFRMIIRKMLRLHARPIQVGSYINFYFCERFLGRVPTNVSL